MRSRAALGSVVLVCVGLTACDVVFSGFKEQASDTWTKKFPIAAGGRVEVLNSNGFVKVEVADVSQVEVRAERIAHAATQDAAKALVGKIEIREEVSPDRVRLETRKPEGSAFSGGIEVRYTLRVPSTVQVDLTTANGEVSATGVTRGARLTTTNGHIRGDRLSGELRATTTNGGVDLTMTSVTDPVHVRTTNGGVDLSIPSSSAVTINAQCANGSIDVSGLEFRADGEAQRCHTEGRANGGGTRVEVGTTNGGISIKGK
jgi:Toastrack DUF4097